MAIDDKQHSFVFVNATASARLGESEGFDQLYERFARDVYVLGLFECYSDPESLVDDVVSHVFAQVDSFVGSEPIFAGLLFRVAIEKIVNERLAEGLEFDEHLKCGLPNFDDNVGSARFIELHDSLHWLSFNKRVMLHLRLTFGLNLLQAARVMGISIDEARSVQASIERALLGSPAGVDLLAQSQRTSVPL